MLTLNPEQRGIMLSLTKKQKQVLDFIRNFVEEHGYIPSYAEIADGLGLSSASNIHAHIENLKLKGYLTKKWNSNRSLDLSSAAVNAGGTAELPLVGYIAAGLPIEAVSVNDRIAVPSDMLGRDETYVLRVKGDSMVDDHVIHDDFVIVEKRSVARDGEMVVALIRNTETTLKRYYRDEGRIRLEPANPLYKPQIYDEEDVVIQGVVIGIMRKFR